MKKSLGPKTIVYPTPVFVVGTYGQDGKPNVMTAAWGGICCLQLMQIPTVVSGEVSKASANLSGTPSIIASEVPTLCSA